MPAPVVKVRGRHGGLSTSIKPNGTRQVTLQTSDPCPICGHLLSQHAEERLRQCDRCACQAQDVEYAN